MPLCKGKSLCKFILQARQIMAFLSAYMLITSACVGMELIYKNVRSTLFGYQELHVDLRLLSLIKAYLVGGGEGCQIAPSPTAFMLIEILDPTLVLCAAPSHFLCRGEWT